MVLVGSDGSMTALGPTSPHPCFPSGAGRRVQPTMVRTHRRAFSPSATRRHSSATANSSPPSLQAWQIAAAVSSSLGAWGDERRGQGGSRPAAAGPPCRALRRSGMKGTRTYHATPAARCACGHEIRPRPHPPLLPDPTEMAARKAANAQREREAHEVAVIRRREQRREVLALLCARWPKVLSAPVPLAIGIEHEIRAGLGEALVPSAQPGQGDHACMDRPLQGVPRGTPAQLPERRSLRTPTPVQTEPCRSCEFVEV